MEPDQYQELYGAAETDITFEEVQLGGGDDPWYIYECLPFLRDIQGFPEPSVNGTKQNRALLEFVKHANTQPMKMVQEFVSSKKGSEDCSESDSSSRFNLA